MNLKNSHNNNLKSSLIVITMLFTFLNFTFVMPYMNFQNSGITIAEICEEEEEKEETKEKELEGKFEFPNYHRVIHLYVTTTRSVFKCAHNILDTHLEVFTPPPELA